MDKRRNVAVDSIHLYFIQHYPLSSYDENFLIRMTLASMIIKTGLIFSELLRNLIYFKKMVGFLFSLSIIDRKL